MIGAPNQAWCSDITYIGMQKGFAYPVAVMDGFSRYVLSGTLSNTQEANGCARVYQVALSISQPEIFHSDRGSRYKSEVMTGLSKSAGIRISMCGRGRCFDNILIERLWRRVKYEEVHLREYTTLPVVRKRLDAYFAFYNPHRPHRKLQNRSTATV